MRARSIPADPVLARLAREGTLVAFELEQADHVRIEVAVGSPLTGKEGRDEGPEPPRAVIAIPSWRLRVEGYNNPALAPEPDRDATCRGRPFAVPPSEPRHLIIVTIDAAVDVAPEQMSRWVPASPTIGPTRLAAGA